MLSRFRSKLATFAQTRWSPTCARNRNRHGRQSRRLRPHAWWENHKEAREEEKHLRTLASDFGQNATRLKELVALEDKNQAASLS